MNTLIKFIGAIGPNQHMLIGILETPCYPCKYYAGIIIKNSVRIDDFIPADNSTNNFHRTIAEAEKAARDKYFS